MNILPKKRWHVRTRENIARVRKDEAAAAEEEKKRVQKIELAEKEARTELLRSKARAQYGFVPKKEETKTDPDVPLIGENGHVNLFYELEQNSMVSNKTNAEHEKEAKAEKEKEEMRIGYLTYLGQDTNELTGNVSWYNKPPTRPQEQEIGLKEKLKDDPLNDIRKYLETDGVKEIIRKETSKAEQSSSKVKVKKKKKKKESLEKMAKDILKKKKSSSKLRKLAKKILKEKEKKKRKKRRRKSGQTRSSSCSSLTDDEPAEKLKKESNIDLEKLRAERLQREQTERARAAAVLARLRGDPVPEPKPEPQPAIIQKYNSQFNPMIARQNQLDEP